MNELLTTPRNNQIKQVYLGYAARTPILEASKSPLRCLSASELGAVAVRGVMKKSGLPPEAIDEVITGQVCHAGSRAYPHRQVVLKAGLPASVPARGEREECSSGMTSILTAYDALTSSRKGAGRIIIAVGMENMYTPWLVQREDVTVKFNPKEPFATKEMIRDGAPISDSLAEGLRNSTPTASGEYLTTIQCADICAKKFGYTKEQVDEYALRSWKRAIEATGQGFFKNEIIPLQFHDEIFIEHDEAPFNALQKYSQNGVFNGGAFEKILRSMTPIYDGGIITPMSASRISNGASALLVFSEDGMRHAEKEYNITLVPQARIIMMDRVYLEPELFPETPLKLARGSLIPLAEHDVYIEANEAFPPVVMTLESELHLNPENINRFGGAVAMGHPVGCSGNRIVTTLLNIMCRLKKHFGFAVICVGGGGGTSLLVERV
ncbi:MAG: thiolase family protein [bacterium]|nr:thiolase family protein [bacterium]